MANVAKLDPERKFAALMGGRSFAKNGGGPSPAPFAPSILRAGDVDLGELDTGGAIGIDLQKLIEGRLLIQGASGAGKSWTLRRLLEQTARQVQQIVADPEGEFRGLAERFGHVVIEAHRLDAAALAIAARRAREHRVSVLLDLSDSELDREDQMIAFSAFFSALVDAPREHWHTCLVAVDEAHLFAPFGGHSDAATSVRKAAIGALVDLMSRGRKRGLSGVLATQRLARLSKSVASDILNFMVGLNTLDLDIRRAAETIGWDARKAFDRLPMLSPGDFVGVGPGFSRSPAVLRVGPVATKHDGAAPAIERPAELSPAAAKQLLELDALVEASAADAETRCDDELVPGLRAIRGFIRDPAFSAAGKVFGALAPLAPDGTTVRGLAKHLKLSIDATAAGVALLDQYGVLEFSGEGNARAVRIARGMRT